MSLTQDQQDYLDDSYDRKKDDEVENEWFKH